jgi:16S rRNA (adenine1518-N6/adenine1519-N6)-dimethyltransferase
MTDEPRGARALLAERALRPKKSFGQNFLLDDVIAARIADLAGSPRGGTVVEIGAGTGSLTRPLLERAAHVIAIERDRDLVPLLREDLRAAIEEGRLEIVETDAKRFDFGLPLGDAPRPRVVTGNLPYQLVGPLLELSVGFAAKVDRIVYMVQLEVADRLTARPSGAAYGALSVFMQAAFRVERAFVVRRGAFYPQPGVDSAVVVLTPHVPPIAVETPAFRAVVRAAFAQRRKTLRNAWRNLPGMNRNTVSEAALMAGIDLDARGETLDVAAFARMAEHVPAVVP